MNQAHIALNIIAIGLLKRSGNRVRFTRDEILEMAGDTSITWNPTGDGGLDVWIVETPGMQERPN